MLVLSRKQNQEIIIGDNIKITVLKMKGNTVRLGIEAPRDVNVIRGELPRHEPHSEPVASDSAESAEFTVVFSNSKESPTVDVIPFESGNAPTGRSKHRQSDVEPNSIQFRGKLPESLQHNRLKEIVSQLTALTAKSDATNS